MGEDRRLTIASVIPSHLRMDLPILVTLHIRAGKLWLHHLGSGLPKHLSGLLAFFLPAAVSSGGFTVPSQPHGWKDTSYMTKDRLLLPSSP